MTHTATALAHAFEGTEVIFSFISYLFSLIIYDGDLSTLASQVPILAFSNCSTEMCGSAVDTGGGICYTIKTKAIFRMASFLNYPTTKRMHSMC